MRAAVVERGGGSVGVGIDVRNRVERERQWSVYMRGT